MWPYVAAGVACVMRVVVTTPVDWPATAASSSALTVSLPRSDAQLPRSVTWSTPITPARVFTPDMIAVIVPAESGVWKSVSYVRESAVAGKFSNESRFSSPEPPFCWPS